MLDTQAAGIERRIRELQELHGQLIEHAVLAGTLPPPDVGVTCQLIEHVRQKVEAAVQPGA